ncbi:pantetheinase-like [Palaemon carinicauda]|uniref:pantetheinase-like n=1 Tax=Palaemon carinicauda TaxID=392227 RepID=UPI0035B6343B
MTMSFSRIVTFFSLSCLVATQSTRGQYGRNIQREHNYDFHKDAIVETEVEYIAAALQYAPFDDLSVGGQVVLEENARAFIKYAKEAREMGAQIIVFPEYGLTSLNLALPWEGFLAQTQVVPDPEDKEVPCEYTDVKNSSKIMKELSCAAKETGIYLVVDLAEQSNCSKITFGDDDPLISPSRDAFGEQAACKFYNSQVVFDDTGAVVARYRKKHLFVEPLFTPGTEPDSAATFETSFGVTFTLLICFDILYESPAVSNIFNLGVRDAIMSTAWMDQLPFLVAHQVWKGFTEGFNVNLVVANIYEPPKGFLGAGIFRGVSSEPEYYTYDTSSGTKLIVGRVKTKSSSPAVKRREIADTKDISYKEYFDPTQNGENYKSDLEHVVRSKTPHKQNTNQNMHQKYKHQNLSRYNYTILERTPPNYVFIARLCHDDDLCCTLAYSYPAEDPEDVMYMLVAYSGIVGHAHDLYLTYVQNCGVVLCLNDSIASCAHIEEAYFGDSAFRAYSLSGTFSERYIYPSVLTDSVQLFNPTQWNYTFTEKPTYYHASIDLLEEVNDLLTLSLYSRWFSRDPNY